MILTTSGDVYLKGQETTSQAVYYMKLGYPSWKNFEWQIMSRRKGPFSLGAITQN
jgi:hypothetical protein